MNSFTTLQFREQFKRLPKNIQKQAKRAFKHFQTNPFHPSLFFKKVHPTKPIYSVRISMDYRAVGIKQNNDIVWYWIGSHSNYDKLLKQMKND